MQWFRLAALLGSTVEELQSRMTSAEFAEWCGFLAMEPHGPLRDEVHARLICTVVAAAAGSEMQIDDFALEFDRRPQSVDEMRAIFRRAAATSRR